MAGLDRRATAALALVALVAVVGALLVARQVAGLRTLAAALARERAAASAPLAEVRAVTDEERRLWAQLADRLRRRYPGDDELPAAMAAVAEWARTSGLEVVALDLEPVAARPSTGTPARATSSPPAELTEHPTRLKLVARHRYRDLVRFVDGLGRLPVYVVVHSLDIRRTDDRLTSELSLVSLRWGA
jgi:Tfp pilus assembly protein PilO